MSNRVVVVIMKTSKLDIAELRPGTGIGSVSHAESAR